MLVVKVRQMSPLYQIKLLLNLVQIATDYSVYTGLDVCKKSCKYLWSFSRYSGKCRVAPFLLDHPVYILQLTKITNYINIAPLQQWMGALSKEKLGLNKSRNNLNNLKKIQYKRR